MTDRQNPLNNAGLSEILQDPWLHQSYLIGHSLEQRERYADALEVYNTVLEQDPGNILAHLLKGGALLNLNLKQETLAIEKGALMDARSLDLNLKREKDAQAAFRQALQLAEQAVQQNEKDTQAWVYKGDALWMLDIEDAEATITSYDQAIRLSPDDPEAYVNKGWVLLMLNQHEEALKVYQRALQLRPDDPDIHYRLNCVLFEMQRYEEALQALEQAIALDPTQPRFFSGKAMVLSYLGRGEEAQQMDSYGQHLLVQYPASGSMKGP